MGVFCAGNNNIGADGARAIADALKTNSVLTTLHFGCTLLLLFLMVHGEGYICAANNIGADGAKAIAESLKKNSTLTELDIGASF